MSTWRGIDPWSVLSWHRPDVFLVQWPETVFDHSLVTGLAVGHGIAWSASLLRRRGCKVVWIAHNLQSHERRFPRAEDRFWKCFCKQVDATVALSQAGLTAALDRHPDLANKPGIIVPHGHYRGVYPDTLERNVARQRQDVPDSARVILFLGRILTYKNVPALVSTFRAWANPNDQLWIVGRPREENLGREILAASQNDPRIRTEFGFVPDERLQEWFRAADLCVLPFREILNSGSAILSLSFDLPILVPDRGAMAELGELAGSDWVRTYSGNLTVPVLDQAMRWATSAHRSRHASLERLEWKSIGADFTRDLRDLVSGT